MSLELRESWAKAFSAADPEAVARLCAHDVTVELNIPHGTMSFEGADKLAASLVEGEFVPGYTVVHWAGCDTDSGIVMELEIEYVASSGPVSMREAHIVRVHEGLVDDVVVYCTGEIRA